MDSPTKTAHLMKPLAEMELHRSVIYKPPEEDEVVLQSRNLIALACITRLILGQSGAWARLKDSFKAHFSRALVIRADSLLISQSYCVMQVRCNSEAF